MIMRKVSKQFLLYFGFASLSFGQDKIKENNQDGIKRFLISISVGNVPLPGTNTSILPGAEVFVNRRISLFGEVAFFTGNRNLDSTAVNKKYLRLKAELRYYLSKKETGVEPYLGLQYTSADRSFDVQKTDFYYEQNKEDSIFKYDRAKVMSPVKTLTLQVGTAIRIWRRVYGDMAVGYGYRFINTGYHELVNLRKERRVGFLYLKPISSYRYIGNMTRSQFNLNFRLSYLF